MNRTASEAQVKRESEYYKANIDKVTSVEGFLDDYQLYSYAMKAYGLEDMTYAKAFMKKVLESDLSDENSFANKLTDTRYKEFAAAYQFGSGTKVPQSESQTDELIGLYNAKIDELDEQITTETNYYKAMTTKVTSVDEFLSNDRLRAYMFKAYDIDESTYDRTLIRNLLTSNPDDPDSYYNTTILPKIQAAQEVLTNGQPTLDKIDKRASYLADVDGLQSYMDDIAAKRAEIAQWESDKSQSGADVAALSAKIATNQQSIDQMFAEVVNGKISDWTSQITDLTAQKTEDGADVDAIQAQIDGIQANIDTWQTDYDSRTAIADKRGQIATLEASKNDSGADVTSIQAQIDALNAEIDTASGTLQPLDVADLAELKDEKQAAADALGADLPPVGAETEALRAKIAADLSDATTYITAAAGYETIVNAFNFNGDGSVPADGFQNADQQLETTNSYIYKQDRLTKAGALLNDEYFKSKINTFTNVEDMLADARILSYLKDAFGLSSYNAIVTSTLENAITSDPDDPDSYLNKYYKGRDYYDGLVALSKALNFNSEGKLDEGTLPMDEATMPSVSSGYFSGYDDVAEAADETAITNLKAALNSFNSDEGKIANVDDLVNNSAIYEFAMKAVGLDSSEVSKRIMKKVLSSDLQDPKSFVYTLKDDRYVQFAGLFNFDKDGKLTWSRMAQSEEALQQTAKDYIVQKTRFLTGDEQTKAKTDAETESKYYQEKIAALDTKTEFLSDRRLVDFVLTANGIDPETVTDEYMKKIFDSDLTDPKSFANTETDYRFAEIAASFNFDKSGNVVRVASDSIQTDGDVMRTMNLYLRQTIESDAGEESDGVRLALYFERKASTITSAYDILGDTALLEFFRTTFSLPETISSMDVDQQAKLVEKNMTLSDLDDPEKLKKLISRFSAMYDMQNDSGSSAALTLLTGGSSGGISADLMLSLSQLKLGG